MPISHDKELNIKIEFKMHDDVTLFWTAATLSCMKASPSIKRCAPKYLLGERIE